MHARFREANRRGTGKDCWRAAPSVGSDVATIERRVGTLLGQNTRAAGLFDVQVRAAENGAAQIEWKKIEKWRAWAQLSEGSYVLRSNVSDWSDEDLWRAYIQLTEAETAFRIQKSDLSLRPVWHQKEDRVLAHILVCFLAYVLWKFLGQLCQKAGSRRRTATRAGRTQRTPRCRSRSPHTQDGQRNPHPLRHTTQRPPENPAQPARLGTAGPTPPDRNVVPNLKDRVLRRKHLRQILGEVGLAFGTSKHWREHRVPRPPTEHDRFSLTKKFI